MPLPPSSEVLCVNNKSKALTVRAQRDLLSKGRRTGQERLLDSLQAYWNFRLFSLNTDLI